MRCKLLGLFSSLVFVALGSSLMAASENGSAGDMPAYYASQLFTINFKELPPGGEDANLQHNGSINFIFMSDNGLPGGQPLSMSPKPIRGTASNPLCKEGQITFNPGRRPFQSRPTIRMAMRLEPG